MYAEADGTHGGNLFQGGNAYLRTVSTLGLGCSTLPLLLVLHVWPEHGNPQHKDTQS